MKDSKKRVRTRYNPIVFTDNNINDKENKAKLDFSNIKETDASELIQKLKSHLNADEKLICIAALSEYMNMGKERLEKALKCGLISAVMECWKSAMNSSDSVDLVIECLRILARVSSIRVDCLKQLVNEKISPILLDMMNKNVHVDVAVCELLGVLCGGSEKIANELSSNYDFINNLFSRSLSVDVPLAYPQLLFVLVESNAPALDRFISEKRVEAISDFLSTQNDSGDQETYLYHRLFLVGIVFHGLWKRESKKLWKCSFKVFLETLTAAFSKLTQTPKLIGFLLDLISLSTILMDGFNFEDDAVELLQNEHMTDHERGDVEMDEWIDDVEGKITESHSDYCDWLKASGIWGFLIKIVLNDSSNDYLIKIKAINVMQDVILNASSTLGEKIGTDDLLLFQKEISVRLLVLFQSCNDQVTKFFLFSAFSELLWTLSRAMVEVFQIDSCADDITPQTLFQMYSATFQAQGSNEIPEIIVSSTRLNIVGILSCMMCTQKSLSPDTTVEIFKFLIDRLDMISQPVETSPYVLAELVNAFIDLFAPDERNLVYDSIPGLTKHLSESLLPSIKSITKSLDPRKPIFLKKDYSHFDEWKLCIVDRVSVYQEGRFARDRLWDMFINLKRFVEYKKR